MEAWTSRKTKNRLTPVSAVALFRKGVVIGLLLLAHHSVNATCPCDHTPVTLDRVVDGNTVWVWVDGVLTEVRFALTDVPNLRPDESGAAWCPEEAEKAIKAKALTERLLRSAENLAIEITAIDSDDRTLAVVYADGFSVGQELMYKGLGVEKSESVSWCD